MREVRADRSGMSLADWQGISDSLEAAARARNLGEFYDRAIEGAQRLVECDKGVACYRDDHGLPYWLRGGPEGLGQLFNDRYRHRFPVPIRSVDRSAGTYLFSASDYEDSEYVRDFLRTNGVEHLAGALAGSFQLSGIRSGAMNPFNSCDVMRLEIYRRHLEGIYLWMRRAEENLLHPGGQNLGGLLPRVLSRREVEVVFEAAHGLSSRDIGLVLGISPRTAERHLANAYGKLRIKSRVEQIGRAHV